MSDKHITGILISAECRLRDAKHVANTGDRDRAKRCLVTVEVLLLQARESAIRQTLKSLTKSQPRISAGVRETIAVPRDPRVLAAA